MTDDENQDVWGWIGAIFCFGIAIYILFFDGLEDEPKPPIPYPPNITAQQKLIIDSAIDVFELKCPGVIRWDDDLRLARVSIEDYASYKEGLGWPVFIRLEYMVADPLTRIRDVRFTGHHLYYDLGGGKMPGIVAGKSVAQDLCDDYMQRGRPQWPSDYKPVPQLRLVDPLLAVGPDK